MDYMLLETFVIVSETLNLTKASELLFKTQPTITNRINKLESALGFSLFIRQKGRRTIELTKKGADFLPIAKQLMDFYGKIETTPEQTKSHLNISTIESVGTTIISEICKKLANPNISLSIKTYQTREAYELVRNREIDLAFVSEVIDIPNVTCEPIFKQELLIIKPCRNPVATITLSPKEFDSSKEIFVAWGSKYQLWHDSIWGNDVKPRIEVDSCAMLAKFLLSEDDWAVVQAGNLEWLSTYNSFQTYRLDDGMPMRICYMLTHSYPDKNTLPLLKNVTKSIYKIIHCSEIAEKYIIPFE